MQPQSKRRILEGVCVSVKSCIWKTFIVKYIHLFFIFEKKNYFSLTFCAKNFLTLLKRITDTFKCLALPKRIDN